MDDKLKKKWIDALRSGKYKQTTGALRRQSDNEVGYCCLGVLCEVAGLERIGNYYSSRHFRMEGSITDTSLQREWGLDKKVVHLGENAELQDKLVALNDDSEKSFEQIANYLERINF